MRPVRHEHYRWHRRLESRSARWPIPWMLRRGLRSLRCCHCLGWRESPPRYLHPSVCGSLALALGALSAAAAGAGAGTGGAATRGRSKWLSSTSCVGTRAARAPLITAASQAGLNSLHHLGVLAIARSGSLVCCLISWRTAELVDKSGLRDVVFIGGACDEDGVALALGLVKEGAEVAAAYPGGLVEEGVEVEPGRSDERIRSDNAQHVEGCKVSRVLTRCRPRYQSS